MPTSRRLLLKQFGLGLTGIGLGKFESLAGPVSQPLIHDFRSDLRPIILSSNENPYGPSPFARKAFAENLTMSNRYNWEVSSELMSAIAKKNNLPETNVAIGAGSTEMLDLVSKMAASDKGSFVIADPSYNYWTVTLDKLGMNKIKVPLTTDKKIDLQAMLSAISADTRLVYICNPNNPSGTMAQREELVNFVNKVPGNVTILVDEAYLDFTKQESLSNLINGFDNLVIVKTFSKIYGLAGARIGYALAGKKIIDKISDLQSSPNGAVSVLSRLAAIESLKDQKFVSDCKMWNEAARTYTIDELRRLHFPVISSNTSFIYFSLDNFKKDYFKLLKDNNIQGTRLYEEQGKWTRITVGTMPEMKQFIKALQ